MKTLVSFLLAYIYDTFQSANNKGADQSVQMGRLVCAFVVCKPSETGFLKSRPIQFVPSYSF